MKNSILHILLILVFSIIHADRILGQENDSQFFQLESKVISKSGNELKGFKITVINLEDQRIVFEDSLNSSIQTTLEKGKKYRIEAVGKDYLKAVEEIEVEIASESRIYVIEFILSECLVSHPPFLSEVLFDFNSSELNFLTRKTLDTLIQVFEDNPSITWSIGGHSGFNEAQRISKERTEVVLEYIFKEYKHPEKFKVFIFGHTHPVWSRKEVEELPDDLQSEAKRKNQRTEISVLSWDE
ncbi:MAG: hypothetical protein AAF487_01710 [Bacteroidota bacterium]